MIRVDRRAARLDDHGFATRRSSTGGAAVRFCGPATSFVSMKQPGVSQAGHAHRGEHSTSHLDPSHRTQTPSLGKSRTWVVQTHGTQAIGQPRNSRQLLFAACDARRSSSGCCRYPVPVATTVKRTSVHRQFQPVTSQSPQPPSRIVLRSQWVPCDSYFGRTKTMNRRDRHDALNLSNRYFVTGLRRFVSRVVRW